VRIAQIAPPWLSIPPDGYGGVEAVVGALVEGLVQRGHDVTLFASAPSTTSARLSPYYERPLGTTAAIENPLLALPHVLHAYAQAGDFDVVHDHAFPIGPSFAAMLDHPAVVHTVHTPPDRGNAAGIYEIVGRRVALVAVSNAQRASRPDLAFAATIHNGIPLADWSVRAARDDFLLFVGRMSAQKGVHVAVKVATQLGRRLVIAAKMTDPPEVRYFEQEVRPLLTDAVTFLGEVDRRTLAALYRDASCLLAPAQWPEAFGLTMVEAMACGTPVVALRSGAAAEIVEHGVTGFLAADLDELVGCVERTAALNPGACRRRVEDLFSADRMVDAYDRLYATLRAR
jgi:glycosyltransferase involved in cell wall biosynthesis